MNMHYTIKVKPFLQSTVFSYTLLQTRILKTLLQSS